MYFFALCFLLSKKISMFFTFLTPKSFFITHFSFLFQSVCQKCCIFTKTSIKTYFTFLNLKMKSNENPISYSSAKKITTSCSILPPLSSIFLQQVNLQKNIKVDNRKEILKKSEINIREHKKVYLI